MKKWINTTKVKGILDDFHLVTIETAFVVRTFFFVVFGITIALSSLLDLKVAIISICVLIALYLSRFLFIKIFIQKDIYPQVFLSPRGLITILLFFAIPPEYQTEAFNSGILLYTIIISCIIMAVALVASGKKVIPVEDMSFIYGPTKPDEEVLESNEIIELKEMDSDKVIPPEN